MVHEWQRFIATSETNSKTIRKREGAEGAAPTSIGATCGVLSGGRVHSRRTNRSGTPVTPTSPSPAVCRSRCPRPDCCSRSARADDRCDARVASRSRRGRPAAALTSRPSPRPVIRRSKTRCASTREHRWAPACTCRHRPLSSCRCSAARHTSCNSHRTARSPARTPDSHTHHQRDSRDSKMGRPDRSRSPRRSGNCHGHVAARRFVHPQAGRTRAGTPTTRR